MLADIVLLALTRVLYEALTCVHGTDGLRVVNCSIKEENPLNHFDQLIDLLLVLALVDQGLDIMELRGARLLRSH